MEKEGTSSNLINLLNMAVARELQVSIQYMFQHALGASQGLEVSGETPSTKQSKFVASHALYFLPGSSLKKIAITEMRHAEAIAERVVLLGGEPTTQPDPITIDKTTKAMLENDKEQERGAIELYGQIIDVAGNEHDDATRDLFKWILSDEEKHHHVFSTLLAGD
jgi:bacterioferritin